ncbi:MAG: lysophospholipid acyltransferase family protein, partial [Hyphomicrobiales bacterium]
MIFVRSVLFNIFFYLAMLGYMLTMFATIWLPRKKRVRFLQSFGHTQDRILRIFAGINVEYRGLENLPEGPVIIACKHQSVWETFSSLTIVDDPAIILKRELAWVPLFGWLTILYEMINVQRGKRGAAIKSLVRGARRVVAQGRQIVIFPEGTRRAAGAEPDYKAGLPALYSGLDIPCVP